MTFSFIVTMWIATGVFLLSLQIFFIKSLGLWNILVVDWVKAVAKEFEKKNVNVEEQSIFDAMVCVLSVLFILLWPLLLINWK